MKDPHTGTTTPPPIGAAHNPFSGRYLVTVCGADYAGQLWLQGFNDVGQVLFGMAANELKALEVRESDFLLPESALMTKKNRNATRTLTTAK